MRRIAELPEDRAAGPVVYGGSVDVTAQSPQIAGAVGGVIGGIGTGRGGGVGPPALPRTISKLEEQAAFKNSSVEGATGATLGELFEYNFATPVTIKKNQSAMLPFLQDRINARKLLIYTERDGEHPVNAAEVINNTSKTLDGGPITVYGGGAYAGEALFETLKAGDKRLVGYAVDYGTRITTAFESGRQYVREIHVKDGVLQLRYSQHDTRIYTIKNVDLKPKTLIVQQEGINQYSVLSPKPAERTATAYRFEVKVPASGSQALKVEQERVTENSTVIRETTPDFLLSVVENKELNESGRKQLQAVIDLKRRIAEVESGLETAKSQMTDLTQDQTRLRQNIDSLNRVKGQEDQVRKYSSQLAENETQLAKLRDQRRDLTLRKSSLDGELRAGIDALDF